MPLFEYFRGKTVSQPAAGSSAFTFTLQGGTTQSYRFEAATNLPPPRKGWVAVSNIVTGTNGVFIFTDPQRTNLPRRFFRVREL